MKPWMMTACFLGAVAVCAADDKAPEPPATRAATPAATPAAMQAETPAATLATTLAATLAAQRAARPRQAAPVAASTPSGVAGDHPSGGSSAGSSMGPSAGSSAASSAAASAADEPQFVSEGRWLMAGYNNNEPVYTILVTNQDSRILRCTTDMQGFYFDDGAKLSISDRQVATVFPNEQTKVGNWMDMDEKSGATYTVKCKPV